MKLLFDQNISFRIVKIIEEKFPESAQVMSVGLENASDLEIWKYAKLNNFTIVTFDSDFAEIATLRENPPKIIRLKLANSSTIILGELILSKFERIKEFLTSDAMSKISILEIYS